MGDLEEVRQVKSGASCKQESSSLHSGSVAYVSYSVCMYVCMYGVCKHIYTWVHTYVCPYTTSFVLAAVVLVLYNQMVADIQIICVDAPQQQQELLCVSHRQFSRSIT